MNHNLRSYWIIELSEHGTENPRQMTLSMIGFFSMTTNVDGVSVQLGQEILPFWDWSYAQPLSLFDATPICGDV